MLSMNFTVSIMFSSKYFLYNTFLLILIVARTASHKMTLDLNSIITYYLYFSLRLLAVL